MKWFILPACFVCALACVASFAILGCAGEPSPEEARTLDVRTHPYGTLLLDTAGHYWVASTWPTREEVSDAERASAWFDPTRVILMTRREEGCYRADGSFWHERDVAWRLARGDAGAFVYVREDLHESRSADLFVVRAWHDDPSRAMVMGTTPSLALTSYHDIGSMPLPSGTLVRSEAHLYFVSNGQFRPFANEELARRAGYRLDLALPLAEADLPRYGHVGEPLLEESFTQCPAAEEFTYHLSIHDEDGDGSPREEDCDDHNSLRAPTLTERCDGIDNDCDGQADEDFPTLGNTCQPPRHPDQPGIVDCSDDGRTTTCREDNDNEI